MLRLFMDNLLPVFLIATAGYLLAWRGRLDPRPLSQIVFYLLVPCLVYQLILDSRIAGAAMLQMTGFAAASLLVVGGLAALIGRALGWSRTRIAALVLVSLLPNAGNFGLSATLFAFGEEALAHATIFFVTSSVLTFTVGVFVVSLGRQGPTQAVSRLARVPAVWAIPTAFLVRETGLELPVAPARAIELVAQACIPLFLIVLGMQMRQVRFRGAWGALALGVGLRLVGGAVAGIAIAGLMGLDGPTRQAGVLQAAMPPAVITIILATEFDVEPGLVTSTVFLGTLLCPLTLTPLLALLGA